MGGDLLDTQMAGVTLFFQERVVIELQIDHPPYQSGR